MKNIILEYKKDLESFVCNHYILLTVFLTVALGYGFALTNPLISTDDTAAWLYVYGGESIAQGRFFGVFISRLLGGTNFTPFWLEFIAIILMVSAGFLYLCLLKKVTKNKLNKICYILFIPIFISYPLINEIFIYNTAVVSIGLGYLMTVISSIMVYEFLNNKKRIWPLLIVPLVFMTAVVSLYESFAGVYIFTLAMILFLQCLYGDNSKFNIKQFLKYVSIFAGILALAVVIEYIVTNTYIDLRHIERSKNAATGIYWLGESGIVGNIKPFLKSLYDSFISLKNVEPVSIFILQLMSVVLLAFSTIKSILKKNYWLVFFALILIFSIFSLSFVQGVASPYRVCQAFALFVALVAIIIYDQTPKKIKPIIFIAILYMVTMQTYDLTKWFYNDNLRFQEDKVTMISVAETIKKDFDETKPVAFIGSYSQKTNLMHNQTNGSTFINWGKESFGGPSVQLLKFLELNGEHLVGPTAEQYKTAQENLNNMTRWPEKGSITEYKGIIVVRF
jgi:hypothetical protein